MLRIDRVLNNLLSNAVKYTDAGSITVTVDGDATSLIIEVADSGRGMSEDDLVRSFAADGSMQTTSCAGWFESGGGHDPAGRTTLDRLLN